MLNIHCIIRVLCQQGATIAKPNQGLTSQTYNVIKYNIVTQR